MTGVIGMLVQAFLPVFLEIFTALLPLIQIFLDLFIMLFQTFEPLLPLFTDSLVNGQTLFELYQHAPDYCLHNMHRFLNDPQLLECLIDSGTIGKYQAYLYDGLRNATGLVTY